MRPPALPLLVTLVAVLAGCGLGGDAVQGTAPPPDGWANQAPTVVTRVVGRDGTQLLEVRQGELEAWISVPDVDADVGDHVLLGRGTPRRDVLIPEVGERAPAIVDIDHVQVVDRDTAERVLHAGSPADAIPIASAYAELAQRDGEEIVVHGTVAKATGAVGWNWVHLRDGTGDPALGTHDLTVQTTRTVTRGQRVSFRGVLRADVDLGFGYHYEALVEEAEIVP